MHTPINNMFHSFLNATIARQRGRSTFAFLPSCIFHTTCVFFSVSPQFTFSSEATFSPPPPPPPHTDFWHLAALGDCGEVHSLRLAEGAQRVLKCYIVHIWKDCNAIPLNMETFLICIMRTWTWFTCHYYMSSSFVCKSVGNADVYVLFILNKLQNPAISLPLPHYAPWVGISWNIPQTAHFVWLEQYMG